MVNCIAFLANKFANHSTAAPAPAPAALACHPPTLEEAEAARASGGGEITNDSAKVAHGQWANYIR